MTERWQRAGADWLVGACAATGATCVSNPIDHVKTRLQLAALPRPTMRILQSLRTSRLSALQVGLRPAIAYNVLLNGARLSLYRPLVDAGAGTAAAGALAGAVGALCASPAWVLKVRSHAGSPTSLYGLVGTEGIGAAYRGVPVAMLRVATGTPR